VLGLGAVGSDELAVDTVGLATMTTVGLPDASTYTTIELAKEFSSVI
jgi:hypothetical protein